MDTVQVQHTLFDDVEAKPLPADLKDKVLVVGSGGPPKELIKNPGLGARMVLPYMIGLEVPYMTHPGMGRSLRRHLGIQDRPERKCLLPGCTEVTTHNGGYCCSGHCLEHRAMLKRR